jgi:hypothetical protein
MIFGPETWSEVRGEAFTYWDRWLLRLAVDEAAGLLGVATQLEARRTQRSFYEADAEAKLAQLTDLGVRLQRLGVGPREVLGEQDATDKVLIRKANEKIFNQTGGRFTPAMRDTPRRRLRERAMRGHWKDFPVSPSPFEREMLSQLGGQHFLGWRETGCLADAIESLVDHAALSVSSDGGRLALHRAALTVIVESMERVDDSLADMATTFSKVWESYWALPWEQAGMPAAVFFRDLIEFTVWENYGMIDGLAAIFDDRAPDDAFVIESVFADLIPELRGGGFDHQEENALRLRVEFLVALGMYELFVDAAAELGARTWIPITAMAEAAMAAGNRPLALAVFAAADQPGLQRDHLRDLCTKMTGEAPTKRSALRLVR